MFLLRSAFHHAQRPRGVRAASNAAWLNGQIPEGCPNTALLKRIELEIAKEAQSHVLSNKRAKLASLKRAAVAILKIDYELKTHDDIVKVAHNAQLTPLLVEFLKTPEEVAETERKELVKKLLSLPRVGPAKAERLVELGVRSVEEGVEEMQRTRRYPRAKLAFTPYPMLKTIGRQHALQILSLFQEAHGVGEYDFYLAGRHRREAKGAREVRIVVTHPDPPRPLLMSNAFDGAKGQISRRTTLADARARVIEDKLVLPMTMRGYVAHSAHSGAHTAVCIFRLPLPDPDPDAESRADRLAAVERKTGRYVMVDLLWTPREALGAALFCCTGDQAFVKLLRARALKRGMALHPWGLYRRVDEGEEVDDALLAPYNASARPDKKKKPPEADDRVYWRFVPTTTERAVFEEIGEEYVSPTRRNFSNVLPGTPSVQTRGVSRKVRQQAQPDSPEDWQ